MYVLKKCKNLWIMRSTFFPTSGVHRKFPRGQSFVTIVWRHKSTLGEVPKARPF